MKRNIVQIMLVLASFSSLLSCQDETTETAVISENFNKTSETANTMEGPEDPIKLGQKLPNPYTVEAMQRAYQELIEQEILTGEELKISETHKYVRFLPRTDEEFDLLVSDSTIVVLDHPFDYEILSDGEYYHDPTLPEDGYTYQYAVLPINYKLPTIQSEILAKIYLDEEGANDAYYLVEEESFKQLGLWTEEEFGDRNAESSSHRGLFCCNKYNPKGQVKLNDISLITNKTRGMNGVKLYVRRWFKTAYALTNSNGDFFISKKYCGKVRYKIKWERSRFTIRQGFWLQAYTSGPYTKSNWNITIGTTGSNRSKLYAMIHTAAEQMYYGNRHGLQRPPGSTWNKLKIGAYKNTSGTIGDHAYWRTLISWPRIRIKDASRSPYNLYSTTVHELSHAIHWALPGNFNQVEDLLVESFASGMDWYFANERYGFGDSMQTRRLSNTALKHCGYTPLIVDLIDSFNQSAQSGVSGNLVTCSPGSSLMISSRGNACFVRSAPTGTTPFAWAGYLFHTLPSSGSCPPGTTPDGSNCRITQIPQGKIHFFDGQDIYLSNDATVDFPSDFVSGYFPYQIQRALHNVTDRNQFKNNLRSLYWNPGEGIELDNLFDNYSNIHPDYASCPL